MPTRAVGQRPNPLRVLAEASASLLATPELSSVVAKILELASEMIHAEAYAVWRTFDDTTWRIVAARGLSSDHLADRVTNRIPSALTAEPIIIPDLISHPFFQFRREFYESEGIKSLLVVPLLIRSRPQGTITFYWRVPHQTTREDVEYAVALANLSAAAITTAELYEAQVTQERRSRFLGEASTLLSSSLNYEETLKQVARMAVPSVADWCSVRIFENGKLTRTAVAHSDPARLGLAEEYARIYPEVLRPDWGVGRVLATGESEIYPTITEETLVFGAQNESHLDLLRKLGMTSVLIVPLNARGRTFGAITMIAAESQRHFVEDDLRLAEDLARRAAVAVDNAQLHRALGESEARFRSLVEQSPVSTVVFDAQGRPLEANPAFERLFGANLTQAPENYSVFDDPQLQQSGLLPDIRRAFAGEHVTLPATRYDTALTSTTGTGNVFWAEAVLYPIQDASGNLVRVVMLQRDVTEKIEAESKRVATEASLRKTEKLAAAGRLAATVAHEINNPLAAVTNILFLMRNDSRVPPDFTEYLATADEELRRVAHIVRQTLGFYRENVEPESTDISQLVADILSLYRRRLAARGISVSAELVPLSRTRVVVGEIKQVIANMLTNAMDACAEGGVITVIVRPTTNQVKITVQDDGVGIGLEDLPHIFEPFFTTKKDVGTGLGLWLSKEIILRHGGEIEVESRTASVSGTRFIVLLPT
jgi:PAS domain S-box-containing protein